VFGVLAGLFGTNLQAWLQAPWVLVPFALLFVALAVSMFGYFDLQLPARWQGHLASVGSKRGGVLGAAGMGFAAALIVGPCLAPPLAGALLYIGASGDALLGAAALFTLGLGMGVPLLLLGAFGGSVLPKAGPWMQQVRPFFGVVLLGVAVWLLSRLLPGPITLVFWALLFAGYGVHLCTLTPRHAGGGGLQVASRSVGLLGVIYAAILLIGAAAGGANPLQPLRPLTLEPGDQAPATSVFTRVDSWQDLRSRLKQAASAGKPALVDFYADWCVECVHMARTVFTKPAVRKALQPIVALQVDVTAYDRDDRLVMRKLGVIGPPSMLFYGPNGQELKRYRLVGATDGAGFLGHLRRVFGP
ncbi:MAG: protein-disulfide reductase DsbD, partial [Salinisphaera sp.]|nr:protein-disulfide reductase DsbD [Salinisphaera sp.]